MRGRERLGLGILVVVAFVIGVLTGMSFDDRSPAAAAPCDRFLTAWAGAEERLLDADFDHWSMVWTPDDQAELDEAVDELREHDELRRMRVVVEDARDALDQRDEYVVGGVEALQRMYEVADQAVAVCTGR